MADSKISALTEATELSDTDELLVNDSGTSKRVTVATVRGGGSTTTAISTKAINGAATGYFPLLGGRRDSTLNDSFTSEDQYFFGFTIGAEVTISHLSVDCIAATASATRKLAIFNASDMTLVSNSTAEFDLGTTGYKTVALAANATLPVGDYYLGSRNSVSGTTQVRCFDHDDAVSPGITNPGGTIHFKMASWALNNSPVAYASWPPATETISSYSNGSQNPPWIIATVV